jgi:hypothetical protein
VERKMAFCDQLAEVLLQCVSARSRESYDVADGDSSVFADVLDDAHRQFRRRYNDDLFPLDFLASRFICCCNARRKNITHGCQFGASVLTVT